MSCSLGVLCRQILPYYRTILLLGVSGFSFLPAVLLKYFVSTIYGALPGKDLVHLEAQLHFDLLVGTVSARSTPG